MFVGSKKARDVVFSVLRDACADGDLSISEALEAVKDIFADNAKQFYKLDAAAKFVSSENGASDHSKLAIENGISPHSSKVATQSSEQDVAFVRMIWVDTSGQHRCRVCYVSFLFFISLSLGNISGQCCCFVAF